MYGGVEVFPKYDLNRPLSFRSAIHVVAPLAAFIYFRRAWSWTHFSQATYVQFFLPILLITMRLFVAAIAAIFLFSACGGGSSSDTPAATSEPAATADTTPLGSASISGAVSFTGTAPDRNSIRLNRECNALHENPVLNESVVVNDNGTLANVFVYVKEGLGEYNYAVPAEPVVFNQEGCVYSPHIFGIQVEQTLQILNSDSFMHNVNALAESNRPFNMGMPNQGDTRDRTFRVPEVMVRIKCDVHAWMNAYVGVVDHPFYAVSSQSGEFSIGDLPAGDYVLEAWHEEFGTATQNVTVTDGGAVSVEFSFGS